MQQKVVKLAEEFAKSFSSEQSSKYWKKAGDAFRVFWKPRILNVNLKDLKGKEFDDLDPIIQILDVNGKRRYLKKRLLETGSQYGIEYEIEERGQNYLEITNAEGAARTLITQKQWYKMFHDLKSIAQLREKLDQVFREEDLEKKAVLIDELEIINEKHRNFLTNLRQLPSAQCYLFTIQKDLCPLYH